MHFKVRISKQVVLSHNPVFGYRYRHICVREEMEFGARFSVGWLSYNEKRERDSNGVYKFSCELIANFESSQ